MNLLGLRSGRLGYATSDVDYPDLALSNNFLYLSAANGRIQPVLPRVWTVQRA